MGTEQAGHLPVMVDRVLALFAPALDPPGAGQAAFRAVAGARSGRKVRGQVSIRAVRGRPGYRLAPGK